MRNPAKVLNSLTKHSIVSSYKFEKLYRIMFNEEMYYAAYQRIYARPGNMTAGSDGDTIDGMSLSRIERLINTLKDETYQPYPSKRVYIKKKSGKKRPLGIPAFDDKLVQEVIRMVLEAIFEGQFEHTSHGFRPKRSCHTALIQVKSTYGGIKWFIEGDIKGFFDNIHHDVLINILKERIEDDRFIRLIRKFLNAGYVEDWVFHKTYSGTPQGGIISPILANIYLDKLDKYMKEYISKFDRGNKRKPNPELHRFLYKQKQLIKKLKIEENETVKTSLIRQIKAIEQKRVQIPCSDEMDTNYRRLKYVRYADDFLVGVIGNLADAKLIKEDIKNFLNDKLKLELSDEKTLITYSENPAKFLSYDVYVNRSKETKRGKATGSLSRIYNKRIVLKMPADKIKKKLLEYGALVLTHHNGTEQWKPCGRTFLINKDDLEILNRFNAEIRGFYNYYSIALNASTINAFKYYMEYSMYKTFGRKYETSVPKIIDQYHIDGNFTVSYDKKGRKHSIILYNQGFKRQTETKLSSVDNLPNIGYTLGITSLIDRLKSRKCELCDAEGDLQMHHIRKMSDIKEGKQPWEIKMIARRRKTMALCRPCHRRIHYGS